MSGVFFGVVQELLLWGFGLVFVFLLGKALWDNVLGVSSGDDDFEKRRF